VSKVPTLTSKVSPGVATTGTTAKTAGTTGTAGTVGTAGTTLPNTITSTGTGTAKTTGTTGAAGTTLPKTITSTGTGTAKTAANTTNTSGSTLGSTLTNALTGAAAGVAGKVLLDKLTGAKTPVTSVVKPAGSAANSAVPKAGTPAVNSGPAAPKVTGTVPGASITSVVKDLVGANTPTTGAAEIKAQNPTLTDEEVQAELDRLQAEAGSGLSVPEDATDNGDGTYSQNIDGFVTVYDANGNIISAGQEADTAGGDGSVDTAGSVVDSVNNSDSTTTVTYSDGSTVTTDITGAVVDATDPVDTGGSSQELDTSSGVNTSADASGGYFSDADGNIYDGEGNLVQYASGAAADTSVNENYTDSYGNVYDSGGNLITEADHSDYVYTADDGSTYDWNGNLIAEADHSGFTQLDDNGNTYDWGGNLISYADGTPIDTTDTTTIDSGDSTDYGDEFTYGKKGGLMHLAEGGSTDEEPLIHGDAEGPVRTQDNGDGTITQYFGDNSYLVYNQDNQVISVTDANGVTESPDRGGVPYNGKGVYGASSPSGPDYGTPSGIDFGSNRPPIPTRPVDPVGEIGTPDIQTKDRPRYNDALPTENYDSIYDPFGGQDVYADPLNNGLGSALPPDGGDSGEEITATSDAGNDSNVPAIPSTLKQANISNSTSPFADIQEAQIKSPIVTAAPSDYPFDIFSDISGPYNIAKNDIPYTDNGDGTLSYQNGKNYVTVDAVTGDIISTFDENGNPVGSNNAIGPGGALNQTTPKAQPVGGLTQANQDIQYPITSDPITSVGGSGGTSGVQNSTAAEIEAARQAEIARQKSEQSFLSKLTSSLGGYGGSALAGSVIGGLLGNQNIFGGAPQNNQVDMSTVGVINPRTTDFGIGPANYVGYDQYGTPEDMPELYGNELYQNLNAPGFNEVNPGDYARMDAQMPVHNSTYNPQNDLTNYDDQGNYTFEDTAEVSGNGMAEGGQPKGGLGGMQTYYTFGTPVDPMQNLYNPQPAQQPPQEMPPQAAQNQQQMAFSQPVQALPLGMPQGAPQGQNMGMAKPPQQNPMQTGPQGLKSGGLPAWSNVPMTAGRLNFRHGAPVHGAGDGQSDDIPAMLADGEYVIDAETVAQIGNGSTKAGAQALDKFRENIRAHKRSAPINKIPPKTKALTSYLKGAR
jgi:hypothetical protein